MSTTTLEAEASACREQLSKLANKETSLFASLPNGQALELRKVLAVVATKLDCVLVQPDPDRSHIQAVLEDLEACTFSDMADLTDSHLLPLLAGNVGRALENEKPAVALDMMAPMLAFFNEHSSELGDASLRGKAFIQKWAEIFSDALSMLQSSLDQEVDVDPSVIQDLYVEVTAYTRASTQGSEGAGDVEPSGEQVRQSMTEIAVTLEKILVSFEEDDEDQEEDVVAGEEVYGGLVRGSSEEDEEDGEDEEGENQPVNIYSGEEDDGESEGESGGAGGGAGAARVGESDRPGKRPRAD